MTNRWLWLPALAVLALVTILLFTGTGLLAQGWLVATLTWGALPLGALAVLMVHGLTGGHWGDASRPVWLALLVTMPLFLVSMALLLGAMDVLFSWTRPTETLPQLVQNKRFYLNEPFFVVRNLIYLVLWMTLAAVQGAWSRVPVHRRAGGFQALGLILWMLALTFFSFDWLISLEPKFYTDIFGFMLALQVTAAAMAVVVLLMAGRGDSNPCALRDLANLWLGLLLGWAFMAFSQYIIIWSGNLPDEIAWYIHRSQGLWRPVSVVSFGLFFLLPFLILLSGSAKGHRGWLRAAAGLCLSGHVLQVAWLVLPAFPSRQPWEYGVLVLLILALGCGYGGWIRRDLAMRQASASRDSGDRASDDERGHHVRT